MGMSEGRNQWWGEGGPWPRGSHGLDPLVGNRDQAIFLLFAFRRRKRSLPISSAEGPQPSKNALGER
jgi:hypothetical protein